LHTDTDVAGTQVKSSNPPRSHLAANPWSSLYAQRFFLFVVELMWNLSPFWTIYSMVVAKNCVA